MPPLIRGASGLTSEEAARRLAEVGPNSLPRPPRVGPFGRILAQLRDPMILLLLAAGVVTVVVSDATDALVIALVVVVNTAVGVTQDLRADRAIAELDQLTAPVAEVVRDGRRLEVPAAEVVPGDVVRLDAGGIVPADLRLLEVAALSIDESAMTGESQPVDRDVGEELLAGTVATRGRAVGEVLRTGADSGLGRIAGLISTARVRDTPLQRRLRRLSRDLVVAVLAIGVVVVVLGLLRGEPLVQTSILAVSLAVAAVPESLPAVVTISLALGAHRMAQRHALVRHLPAVETLGSVTVLASDKTGTLTEGRMVAGAVWVPPGHRYDVSGSGYAPHGDVVADGHAAPPAALERLVRDAVLCNDARLVEPAADGEAWGAAGDTLEAALLVLAAKAGARPEDVHRAWPRAGEVPFEATRGWMATTHRAAAGPGALRVCKGAPEAVLDLVDPPEPLRGTVAAETTRLAEQGFRVIALADATSYDGAPTDDQPLELVGLVGIADPPRAVSREVVAACHAAGIAVVLVTGDHPVTAGAIAGRLGITDEGSTTVTGADLAAGAGQDALGVARVFARIRPEQKVQIVQALQERGEVVAMTGDGVNDAPALRNADIGVAMGRGGTEVARQAADLVLADDDLRTVVAAVEEGRRIYTNIRNFLRYAVSGGLAEVVVVVLGPFFGMALPLLPAQILWINMLTHGLPGVAFGAEPVVGSAMKRPPRPPDESVLGAGLALQIGWVGATIGALSLLSGLAADRAGWDVQTTIFLTLGAAQLAVALALRAPGHRGERRALDIAVAGAAVLQIGGVYLPPLHRLLGTEALPLPALAVAVALALVPGIAVRLRRG
ncbi:Ca2+-transporting ATPase [Nocardioides ginsengisegetis]|uniref:Ca2+-transporting ATPase n=1 Tax=Nocardioides ginsengisegetis TaxID=661491 RepID=A0A7W3J311_9ACTN|nr:HAD-IC family P-type ATPase [Nocardioides ginsengisegetis]MBA8805356.1 Ca2+-transporting ATPase [Nocardioides ginsengisegetis]